MPGRDLRTTQRENSGVGTFLVASAVLGICRFWDDGDRDTALAWSVGDGMIDGVEVTGLGVALLTSTLGPAAKWRAAIHVDERATPVQHRALLKLATGQFGGPFAELATQIGVISAIKRSAIRLDVDGHDARLSIGSPGDAWAHCR